MKYAPYFPVIAATALVILTGCGPADVPTSDSSLTAAATQTPTPTDTHTETPSVAPTYDYLGNEHCQRFSIDAHKDLERVGLTCEQALSVMKGMSLKQVESYLNSLGIENFFTSEEQLNKATGLMQNCLPSVGQLPLAPESALPSVSNLKYDLGTKPLPPETLEYEVPPACKDAINNK